ncbi:hypothetical protein B0H12DRAFT_1103871 [Mycena haematopus]|nr:hypothetical protein B0H12DRAFT_1103871 [Mycena haematopus]
MLESAPALFLPPPHSTVASGSREPSEHQPQTPRHHRAQRAESLEPLWSSNTNAVREHGTSNHSPDERRRATAAAANLFWLLGCSGRLPLGEDAGIGCRIPGRDVEQCFRDFRGPAR